MSAGELELEALGRQREVQQRALGKFGGGRSVAPAGPTTAAPGEIPGIAKADGVLIVTVTRTVQPFREILKGSPEENIRMMYDELTAEVQRRGMKL